MCEGFLILWHREEHLVTMEDFTKWLVYRCIPPERADIDHLLQRWGLTHYNRLAIIKITHGKMAHDDIYIAFEGEAEYDDNICCTKSRGVYKRVLKCWL